MRDFGVVYSSFWLDQETQSLSERAQLFFLYLLTGPHTHSSGCFRLPLQYVAADRKTTVETVSKWFEELFRNGLVYRCERTDFILIPKFLKRNPIKNPNCGKQIAHHLKSIPKNFSYFKELEHALNSYGNYLPNGFEMVSKQFRNKDQDQDQDQDKDSELAIASSTPEPCGPPACQPPQNTPTPLLKIPLAGKNGNQNFFEVQQVDLDGWQETFPGMDVMQSLRVCCRWNCDNPDRRKTAKGIRRHITSWLEKDFNKGLYRRGHPIPAIAKPETEWERKQRATRESIELYNALQERKREVQHDAAGNGDHRAIERG